jgi:hypothetical protein
MIACRSPERLSRFTHRLAQTSNPSPPRLVGDLQTAPREEIFDVAKAKPDTQKEPDAVLDDRAETGGEETRSSSAILPGNRISEIVGVTGRPKPAARCSAPTVLVISRASSGFSLRPGRD